MSAREVLALDGRMRALPAWGELTIPVGTWYTARIVRPGEAETWILGAPKFNYDLGDDGEYEVVWRDAWEPIDARAALEHVAFFAGIEAMIVAGLPYDEDDAPDYDARIAFPFY